MPPADQADTAGRALVERSDDHQGRDWRQALDAFVAETDRRSIIRTSDGPLGPPAERFLDLLREEVLVRGHAPN